MEWLDGFRWYMVVPGLLAYVLLPLTIFFFFCRYCRVRFGWLQGLCYTLLSAGVYMTEIRYHLQRTPGLMMEILLLAVCGCLLLKRKLPESLTLAVLIQSVVSVGSGITSWIGYRILLPFVLEHERWVHPSDTIRECFRLLLVCALSVFILNRFRQSIVSTDRQMLLQLTLPVFFISLVVRTIQMMVYGDELRIDSGDSGIVTAWNVRHGELLFLQIFACACLLLTLYAYQKILGILQAEQKVRLLEQQAAEQEIYLQEALLRERRTRAFRHDIRNHLTVLAKLLQAGETERACGYLSHLEEAASELSFSVRTGNAAVDALLGSKLQAAKQKSIKVQCELMIPDRSAVTDMDWCILLANALDNAVRACAELPEEERRLCITSRKKGGFYLLTVENSCTKELKSAPEDGIGLSNIRAVAEKYQGTVENTVSEGEYRLRIFFGCF